MLRLAKSGLGCDHIYLLPGSTGWPGDTPTVNRLEFLNKKKSGMVFQFGGVDMCHDFNGFFVGTISSQLVWRWDSKKMLIVENSNYSGLISDCPICAANKPPNKYDND